MKKLIYLTLIALTANLTLIASAIEPVGDQTGLPGDNFSLQGALELFKKSESPESFEKMINSQESNVNNLDLNNDGQTDYIRIIDKGEDNLHAIVLQAVVSKEEMQDIAVITIEKTGSEEAMLQIVGDEDIFGDNVILEPKNEVPSVTENPGYDNVHGPAVNSAPVRVFVNVWGWPCVRYIYRPYYSYWVSPWVWYDYPMWWRPWRPYRWDYFYNQCSFYQPYYIVVNYYRVPRACYYYRDYRVYSPSVCNRYERPLHEYRNSSNNARRYNANVPKVRPETSIRSNNRNDRQTTVHDNNGRVSPKTQTPVDNKSDRTVVRDSKVKNNGRNDGSDRTSPRRTENPTGVNPQPDRNVDNSSVQPTNRGRDLNRQTEKSPVTTPNNSRQTSPSRGEKQPNPTRQKSDNSSSRSQGRTYETSPSKTDRQSTDRSRESSGYSTPRKAEPAPNRSNETSPSRSERQNTERSRESSGYSSQRSTSPSQERSSQMSSSSQRSSQPASKPSSGRSDSGRQSGSSSARSGGR